MKTFTSPRPYGNGVSAARFLTGCKGDRHEWR
jgi:hypothetical protein